MEKPHTGLDDWECYCHDLAKGCLQPACCMSACLSVEMGKKRQFIFVRRRARRPTMSPGMTYCSRPLFALPRVDWFSRYRPPRLQWYWLQWHSKEMIAYSDTFSNSRLTFHRVKVFGIRWHSKKHFAYSDNFSVFQHCHCKRGAL